MIRQPVTIGSRGSSLALVQANLVARALEEVGQPSRIVVVETAGDRRTPDTAWGEGAFVAAIEQALLAGRVDVAVHSAKDVPTDNDPRLLIGAYLPRADPRDGLVVRREARERCLDDLPLGSRVGTDSPRRTGFLLARRPDLNVHPLYGNVDKRLRRLDTGETDALLLACAGLDRLGLAGRIVERLDPEVVPPAPGQGAIAVQIRHDDDRLMTLTAVVDDRPTRVAVEAERSFLRATGGGCRAPIGALATVAGDELHMVGARVNPNGSGTAFGRRRGPVDAAEDMALDLAAGLQRDPATRGTVGRAGAATSRAATRRVLVTRASEQAAGLVAALREHGLEPVLVPTIEVVLEAAGGRLDAAARRLDSYDWVVLTSANGSRAFIAAAARLGSPIAMPRLVSVGPATGAVLEGEGIEVAFQPSRAHGSVLAAELPCAVGDRVLVIRGDQADEGLAADLRARGAEVTDVIAYRTHEAPTSSRRLLRRALADGPIHAVVFASGSSVRGLVALARSESLVVATIPSVCIGPATAAAAREAGLSVVAVAGKSEATALAAATVEALESARWRN